MWKQRRWSALGGPCKDLHEQIVLDWSSLIENPETNERACLEFVRDHAAMFFQRRPETPISISELALGSDHRIDFVTVTEGFSSGTSYKLIELESPNSKLFKSDGKTSARLSGAIDQIMEWRRWIGQHRTQTQKLFPSSRWNANAEPTFTYQIVIGRRSETVLVQDKIWSHMHEAGIEITSFDRLTDFLRFPFFHDEYAAGLSSEGRDHLDDKELLNRAASPFTIAISDAVWRQEVAKRRGEFSSHIISPFLKYIVPITRQNEQRIQRFDELFESFTGSN